MVKGELFHNLDLFVGYLQILQTNPVQETISFNCEYGNFTFVDVLCGEMNAREMLQCMEPELFGDPSFLKFQISFVLIFLAAFKDSSPKYFCVCAHPRSLKLKWQKCCLK